jgi:hypothetical protein
MALDPVFVSRLQFAFVVSFVMADDIGWMRVGAYHRGLTF